MTRFLTWLKTHKLVAVLLVIVAFLLLKNSSNPVDYTIGRADYKMAPPQTDLSFTLPDVGNSESRMGMESAPAPEVQDRLVVSNSYLSLLVDNVVEVQNQIIQTAERFGGYMVNSNLNNPQDAPTATVTVRVPSGRLQETLRLYRGLAVKVISENLEGEDVTDQFVDNEARLTTLNTTKAKFEEILAKATQIQDILNVQREIISLQSQIDAIKGEQNYLEKNAEMAKLTVYLSTDELALPYAPSETWRPEVIFKQAVRSLVSQIRKVGTFFIWLVVYSIIWIPILILIFLLKKKGYLNFLR
ncbi:hypothetical protein A3C28_02705 [Candidatus Roizmanbacteria bacterium RIFCSPHIGHO2_02_FULL_39_9]|uniref:DUF4349 domain-containing protein n=2 Tax=Candidatus Roizmaniibacteriota TaxID=1752723 RepID=A0A1F7I1Y2_9BACT|nr:MAG: hypothetical protein A3C28_02705 [Candidatus Roizmanbacteria bacterium RIFCSPHIGHO2_02_FULL_39_9]OGK37389.1 MAG: hypothetical protein A3F60_02190 [Candidatus Roizmanbacteria bacterium RIFCSPHIGHO2_12_FULL_39_8]